MFATDPATAIQAHLDSLPLPKRTDLLDLDGRVQRLFPGCKVWFDDGTDASGKVVSNPNIGYGSYTIRYANGTTKEFFQIGLSANTSGISVYIMGIPDRTHLPQTYAATIGKAKVTGYCIQFKALAQVDVAVLEAAMQDGVAQSRAL